MQCSQSDQIPHPLDFCTLPTSELEPFDPEAIFFTSFVFPLAEVETLHVSRHFDDISAMQTHPFPSRFFAAWASHELRGRSRWQRPEEPGGRDLPGSAPAGLHRRGGEEWRRRKQHQPTEKCLLMEPRLPVDLYWGRSEKLLLCIFNLLVFLLLQYLISFFCVLISCTLCDFFGNKVVIFSMISSNDVLSMACDPKEMRYTGTLEQVNWDSCSKYV